MVISAAKEWSHHRPRNISLETHKAQSTTALSRMAGLGGAGPGGFINAWFIVGLRTLAMPQGLVLHRMSPACSAVVVVVVVVVVV